MTFWDFVGAALYALGEWVSQWWLWLVAVCILICLVGWQLSEKNVQVDEPSQAQKDALRAWAVRNKRPPVVLLDAPEIVELAQDWLVLCRSTSETQEKGEI